MKKVVDQLGFDYSLGNGKTLQDYCPRCKRIMRGLAYAKLPQHNEEVFRGSRIEAGHPAGISMAGDAQAKHDTQGR